MDIREELKVLFDDKPADDLKNKIIQEKIQLEKKLQIIQAIPLARKMEKAIQENFFNGFAFIKYEIKFYALEFSVDYSLQNKDNRTFLRNISPEVNKFLDELSLDINSLNPKYRNQDKLNNSKTAHQFELKPGIGEKMLELFLSQELKTIVDYNKMQFELPSSNESISKKLKI